MESKKQVLNNSEFLDNIVENDSNTTTIKEKTEKIKSKHSNKLLKLKFYFDTISQKAD